MWTTVERATTISLSPPSAPRLRLQSRPPPGSPRTPLDGAWWPRSADPVAELPGLILALQTHTHTADGDSHHAEHGPIAHIMLRVADWTSRPRRLRVDGPADTRVVRLSWFDTLPTGLLTAIWADGRRVDLLTIPPGTNPDAAATALDLTAHPANHLHTPDLLAALTPPVLTPPAVPADRVAVLAPDQTASESSWETEGGRLREPAL
ncbi:DUF5994 family protein [Spirillospora sp. NPDC048911]|uniref:DUF5994 family protein n=1 Tax=Spirillospora sp. NPDC048911 TaxID=3364527 RepID=UPI00371EF2F5